MVTPPTRKNGPISKATVIVLSIVGIALVGVVAISVFFVITLFRNLQSTYSAFQSPSATTTYTGGENLPPGLPEPPPLFAAAPPYFGVNILNTSGMPSVPPDPDNVCVWASTFLADQPDVSTGQSPGSISLPKDVGLIVCDPVPAASTPSSVVDFGVASGHWLHLIAGGQPEFGRTPEWNSVRERASELGFTGLKLTPIQTVPLSHMAGVTHAVCGTISGSATACQLTYQIYSLPDLQTVGKPIVSSGTLEQVEANLPKIAIEIDKDLGVVSPDVPASVDLSTADFTWLGTYAYNELDTNDQLTKLDALSSRSPLAGLLFLQTDAMDDQVLLDKTVNNLVTLAPGNALVTNSIGYWFPEALRPYASKTAALIAKYPGSALLAHVEVWEERSWGNRIDELKAAQRVVDDAPNDPVSWLSRSETLANIAEDVDQGRYSSDLSTSEQDDVGSLHQQSAADDAVATHLDPQFGHAWYLLSMDAAYISDQSTSINAYQHAEKLEGDSTEVDSWGLELYQDKWFGDPFALQAVASRIGSRNYTDADDVWSIADELNGAASFTHNQSYSDEAQNILQKYISQLRVDLKSYPTDPGTHLALATSLTYNGDRPSLREAVKEYRIAEHFLPNCVSIHSGLATALSQLGQETEEIAELQKAVALDPFDVDAHSKLGRALKHSGAYAEAAKELSLAIRLEPGDADAYESLGELFMMQSKYAQALPEFNDAVKVDPIDVAAWEGMAGDLDRLGRYQESINAVNQTATAFTDSGSDSSMNEYLCYAYDAGADDYLHLKDWSDSLQETNKALAITPGDDTAEENIAEAEWGEGNASAAKQQWDYVATLGGYWAPIAKKYLAEHFPAGVSSASAAE